MRLFFALYSWNASPVDGTNISRLLAAKGREFHFPIDLAETPPQGFEGTDTTKCCSNTSNAYFHSGTDKSGCSKYSTRTEKEYHRNLKNKIQNYERIPAGRPGHSEKTGLIIRVSGSVSKTSLSNKRPIQSHRKTGKRNIPPHPPPTLHRR
jgi:hypothetical protein